jgi:(1->4)-alpha-D-glucan 1-alpha-D-glucosylmutase
LNPIPAVPNATYRLQFGPQFTFRDATQIVPYLHDLGISHVYASPFFNARPGSTHGYDITDHNTLNPDVGSPEDFATFSDSLRRHAMGLIVDFVPNHMGIDQTDNEYWLDVLEWGQGSIYADVFDIDWAPAQRHLQGKVLIPQLGDHYGSVLERGEIELRFDPANGCFSAWYHDHHFPIHVSHYAIVIRRQLTRPDAANALDDPARSTLERLATAFDRLRKPGRRLRATMRARALALKADLAACCQQTPAIADFIEAAAASFNGETGKPRSFRPLHDLLERQAYCLAFWRVAADEINYRRFFNINDLAGIRMERQEVFDLTHRLVGRLIADGQLQGLRLDHIDGLFDPRAYCRRLQVFAAARMAQPDTGQTARPFYIVVEKILAHHEALPDDWPVAGTTGYEFTNLVNGLFIDPNGKRGLGRTYATFIDQVPSFDDTLADAKSFVIDNILASEINALAHALDRIAKRHWGTRDYTNARLRAALKEIVAHFPVYRTYVTADGATATDRRYIDWAVSQAKRDWRGPDVEILDFARAALTMDLVKRGGPYHRAEVIRFALKFQQYTGPVMAKAMEDTSFYRHHLLLSLNEVGGDPRQFATSPAAFHYLNQQRSQRWPHSMLATATHDTKRGEDARTRIDVLSEMPELWARRVRRWSRLNRGFRRDLDGEPAPSRNDEYALYQALVGAWPTEWLPTEGVATQLPAAADIQPFADRLAAFLVKAVREAKVVSSWDNPNEAYEQASTAFVLRLFDVSRSNPFLADFAAFNAQVAYLGMLNSLSQLVLKLTAPGVPDIYQGTELWDLSLVDPDNRRAVDFEHRRQLLRQMPSTGTDQTQALRALLGAWPNGRIKLSIMGRLLRLRQKVPVLFSEGTYEPMAITGEQAEHVLAFSRQHGSERVIVVVSRLFSSLLGQTERSYESLVDWSDTQINGPFGNEGTWCDVLTGRNIVCVCDRAPQALPVSELLSVLPVAVLVAAPG